MKTIKYLFAAVALICVTAMNVNAQEKAADKRAGYEFTTVKANPISAIRNQGSSGTCWCFSTTSFLESEAIRLGKADTTLKLSTM